MWIKFDEPKVISSCPKRHRQNVQRLRAKVKSLSHQHHLTTACAAIVSSQNGPTFSHRQYVPLFLLVHSKTSCCSNNKQRFHDGGKQQYTSKVKKAKACRIRLHTSATGWLTLLRAAPIALRRRMLRFCSYFLQRVRVSSFTGAMSSGIQNKTRCAAEGTRIGKRIAIFTFMPPAPPFHTALA